MPVCAALIAVLQSLGTGCYLLAHTSAMPLLVASDCALATGFVVFALNIFLDLRSTASRGCAADVKPETTEAALRGAPAV